MALTRKALAAMGIDAEKIDQIIEMHTESVDALKEKLSEAEEQAKSLQEQAERLPKVEKELEGLKEAQDKAESFEKKYTDLKAEYEEYKGKQAAAKKKADVEAAAKAYFKEHKITGDDNLEIVMRGSRDEINALELDEEGKIKNTEALDALVSGVYAKFVATEGRRGADTPDPPANNGGDLGQPSRAAQLAKQFRDEHYGTKED